MGGLSVELSSVKRVEVGVGQMEARGLMRTGKLAMERRGLLMVAPSLILASSHGKPTTVAATSLQSVKSNSNASFITYCVYIVNLACDIPRLHCYVFIQL